MSILRTLLVTGATAVIVGCGDSPAPPPVAVAPPAAINTAKPKKDLVAAPADAGTTSAEATQYTYTYNPVGKRDPFRSPIDERKNEKPTDGPADGICPDPLCQFDLDQLALVAVVSGDANPVAMLEDSSRVGHIVRRNSKVGKQGGKVSQILRDCIEVTEFFLSPDGKKIPNRVSICVKKEEKQQRDYDLFNNKATE